ncbi:hypothetical protein T10_7907 [Trichinella papuae]|uniref:Uncharacterized protein n=1 Tax=Trichinella papuae TaxID=268474 RepID=A0A0V1N9P0_9BILA|nr:hypothetical protein T10_7907 [Trichinella papuae]
MRKNLFVDEFVLEFSPISRYSEDKGSPRVHCLLKLPLPNTPYSKSKKQRHPLVKNATHAPIIEDRITESETAHMIPTPTPPIAIFFQSSLPRKLHATQETPLHIAAPPTEK